MSEEGKGNGAESSEVSANTPEARIGQMIVEAERQRFPAFQEGKEVSRNLPGGDIGAKWSGVWQKISGGAQETQEQVLQAGLQPLLALLPDDESRKQALTTGLLSAAKYWHTIAVNHKARTGANPPMEFLKLAKERVTALGAAREALAAPKR